MHGLTTTTVTVVTDLISTKDFVLGLPRETCVNRVRVLLENVIKEKYERFYRTEKATWGAQGGHLEQQNFGSNFICWRMVNVGEELIIDQSSGEMIPWYSFGTSTEATCKLEYNRKKIYLLIVRDK
jgi:DNA-binding Lrp family transcriptional regulator